MFHFVVMLVVGIIVAVLGIINMTGNISSLHEYHRNHVKEEDKKPFGKLVGLGTLIIGISLVIFGTFLFIFEQTGLEIFSIIGTAQMIICIIVGLSISLYAIKKYNGKIFG